MITPEAALDRARARAAELGWPLNEPVVTSRLAWSGEVVSYTVATAPRLRGTRARFTIDAATGVILAEGYVPR